MRSGKQLHSNDPEHDSRKPPQRETRRIPLDSMVPAMVITASALNLMTHTSASIRRGFTARVISIVKRIPAGRVATYGDIAALAGKPRAWRSVGNIMKHCYSPNVPCHRVIGSGGRLGGYHDLFMKRQLLQDEGIVVGRHTIRQFASIRWTP